MTLCVILGAGSHARETYWHAKQAIGKAYSRFVFVDDFSDITTLSVGGLAWPVEKEWQFRRYTKAGERIGFVIGIGDPQGKTMLVEKALQAGIEPLPPIVHRSVIIQDPDCRIGAGSVIAPGCILTTNIRVGNYVTLNTNVSVGHDAELEDYVNCAPGVSLAGHVVLRSGVSLGMGTVVREKVSIAPFVTTGAQACIVRNIHDERITVVGVPAKPLRRDTSSL